MQRRIVKVKKMIDFDDVTNENKAEHSLNWLYIIDHTEYK